MVTMIDLSQLETAEEFHARVAAATDDEGRLAVAVEEMPGWDIFPFEIDSLQIKPLHPLAAAEPPRRGEDPAECWCAEEVIPARIAGNVLWSNDRWLVTLDTHMRLPLACNLLPREHCDLTSVPDDLSGELGRLIVAISAAIEELPSVGRAQLAKYGDGGAHLHLFFFGRPDRMLQLRGSPLLDWEENLPAVPLDVVRANAAYVAARLIARLGGSGPAWA
jgi:diadenosine tetraphosphate (Ap4A) HIT family hydrolase